MHGWNNGIRIDHDWAMNGDVDLPRTLGATDASIFALHMHWTSQPIVSGNMHLTHLPPVPHICVNELVQYWFRKWLVACSAPSHYLNKWLLVFNWTLRNKLQWHFNQIQYFPFKKMPLKTSSAKWQSFSPGEELSMQIWIYHAPILN